jgi:3-oxoacyl-[acyl-carrier-protein] synthase II
MIDRRRAVITGMGIVTAAGSDVETVWSSLLAGQSAIRPIERFDASGYPSRIGGEVPDVEAIAGGLAGQWRERGTIAHFAAAAAARAVRDAAAPFAGASERGAVCTGTGVAGGHSDELLHPCAAGRSSRTSPMDWRAHSAALLEHLRPEAMARRTPGSIPVSLALEYGVTGPAMAVMTACAGGNHAIGDALRWIRLGRADVVLTGAADSELYPLGLAAFTLLGALSRRNRHPAEASRPFDADRDGFVMAEGAAMLILEERDRALARGARIYAEVAGFGAAADAYRVTDPHPDGEGAVLAMRRALDDAGCAPGEIDYINAHGTSTPANDRAETTAIRRVFGERAPAIPISSTKSMLGHAMVAASAIEAVVTALTLRDQIIHPTINQARADAECDLDYVPNVARQARVRCAMSNAFGFGGQTASLILREHVA